MKTLLYATDFSKNSITALQYAYKLSTQLNAQLNVIHVFQYPASLIDLAKNAIPEFGINYFKEYTAKLEEFCKGYLGNDYKNVKIEALESNSVLEGILAKAKELNPFLIVVGTKGQSTLKDLIMGNTPQNLIEKGLYPVLSIPRKENPPSLQTFVYATAFEEDDIEAICKLSNLAKPLNSLIKVVHVSSEKDYPGEIQMEWFKEMLNEKISYKKITFEVVTSNDIFSALKLYADNCNADLIAMLERKKGGYLKKLLQKNTVQKMYNYGKYPLISFNISKGLHLNLC